MHRKCFIYIIRRLSPNCGYLPELKSYALSILLFSAILVLPNKTIAQSRISHKGKLEFVENKNQWDKKILFKADIPNGSLFLEQNCFTFNFADPDDVKHSHAHNGTNSKKPADITHFFSYKLHFINAEITSKISASDVTKDYCNYIIGNNKSKWTGHVRKFKTVVYKNIYKDIDLVIYSMDKNLKYDFVVNPGGNINDIMLSYEGIKDIQIKANDLLMTTSFGIITELKPFAYQESLKNKIECKFILKNNLVKFSLAQYDNSKTLVIDPQLIFSTYSGSQADNWGFTATFDNDNNVYSGGIAFGTGYPVTIGAYQEIFAGGDTLPGYGMYSYGEDIAIIKYDSLGKKRLWATYLGGKGNELPHSMVVNSNNELLIFGTTGSDNFPLSENAYSKTFKGGTSLIYDDVISFKRGLDIFVAKLSSDGSQLLASTYIGGTENDGFNFRDRDVAYLMEGNDSLYFNYGDGARGEIITDDKNNVYVGSCTFSDDFPVTSSSIQLASKGREEGIVFKLDNNLTNLLWSSYIGGDKDDAVYSIDIDKKNNVYVAGGTNSGNFPTTSKALKKNYQGGSADGFVAHISGDGTKLLSSTYYGSDQYDQAYFVRSDKFNYPYITGQTKATGSSLIYNANYNMPNSGQFIAKLSTELDSLKWSTVFGTGNGKPNISLTAFAVDVCDKLYLSGWGREWAGSNGQIWESIEGTKNMDITPDAIQKVTDGQDFYVMVLNNDASNLFYATYFGEQTYSCNYSGHDHVDGGTSRFDKRGNIYESACASCGSCQHFPTTTDAWSTTDNSPNCNNAVFKINVFTGLALADFMLTKDTVCSSKKVSFLNKSEGKNFIWKFGDGYVSADKNPTYTYKIPGKFKVTLISIDSASCNSSDSTTKELIFPEPLNVKIKETKGISCKEQCNGIIAVSASGGFPPYNFVWSGGQNDSIITNLCAGIYTVTVYDSKNCNIQLQAAVATSDFSIQIDTIVKTCYNQCKGIAKVKVIGGQQPYAFIWDNGQSDTLATNLCSGNHYLTVTESQGNQCKINFSLSEYSRMIANITDSNQLKCFGDCGEVIKATISGGTLPYIYYWNNRQGYDTLQHICGGNYKLTILDKNNCTLDTNIAIIAPTLLTVEIKTTNTSCKSVCNGSAIVNINGGTLPYTYIWSNDVLNQNIRELCKGPYSITVTDFNNCEVIKSFELKDSSNFPDIKVKAIPDTINFFESSSILVTDFSMYYVYSWSPADGLSNPAIYNPIANPKTTSIYYVTITDYNGCTKVDSVKIFVINAKCREPYIFIPNAFTPDKSRNNILYVRSTMIDRLYFAVFDRWGEKVFESNDMKNGWDGHYRGKLCDPGVFDYYIEATCLDKGIFKHKGNVTLIR